MKKSEKGNILLFVVFVVMIVLFTTMFIVQGATVYFNNAYFALQQEKVTNLADAGLDQAIATLNKTDGNYQLQPDNETVLGEGSYSLLITDIDSNNKTIESIGYLPNKANAKLKRIVNVTVSKDGSFPSYFSIVKGTYQLK